MAEEPTPQPAGARRRRQAATSADPPAVTSVAPEVVAMIREAESGKPTWLRTGWAMGALALLTALVSGSGDRAAAVIAGLVLHDLCTVVVIHLTGDDIYEGLSLGRLLDFWPVRARPVTSLRRVATCLLPAAVAIALSLLGGLAVFILGHWSSTDSVSLAWMAKVLAWFLWFNVLSLLPIGAVRGGVLLRQIYARRPPEERDAAHWRLMLVFIGLAALGRQVPGVGMALLYMASKAETRLARAAFRLRDRAEDDAALDTATRIPDDWLVPLAGALRAETPIQPKVLFPHVVGEQMQGVFQYLRGERLRSHQPALLKAGYVLLLAAGTGLAVAGLALSQSLAEKAVSGDGVVTPGE